jgi:hypothetical protein
MEGEVSDASAETRHLACDYDGLSQENNIPPCQRLDDVNKMTAALPLSKSKHGKPERRVRGAPIRLWQKKLSA